jgi:hypothetical protein
MKILLHYIPCYQQDNNHIYHIIIYTWHTCLVMKFHQIFIAATYHKNVMDYFIVFYIFYQMFTNVLKTHLKERDNNEKRITGYVHYYTQECYESKRLSRVNLLDVCKLLLYVSTCIKKTVSQWCLSSNSVIVFWSQMWVIAPIPT